MEPGTLVIALACQDFLYEKMVSNVQEIKARGAYVLAVAKEGNEVVGEQSDEIIYIPKIRDEIAPLLSVVPLQLFAYFVARERGCNIDKPRTWPNPLRLSRQHKPAVRCGGNSGGSSPFAAVFNKERNKR